MSSLRPQDVVVASGYNTTSSVSIRRIIKLGPRYVDLIWMGSPRPIRWFLAGYPQVFAQPFDGKSAETQRFFHIFCAGSSIENASRFSAGFTTGFRRK